MLPEKIFPQLDAILETAVRQSPRMLNRALDLEIAESNRISAQSGMLPNISAGISYFKSQDRLSNVYSNSAATINSYTVTKTPYNASLSQPLYYWGERRNTAEIGRIQQKIAQGQYREGYRLLAQEVRSAYLRLIVQKLSVQRSRFYVGFTNGQLKEKEDRWAKKEISDADIALARLTAERAQIGVEQADLDFQNAKLSFARLTGTGALNDDAIPDFVPPAVHQAGAFAQLLAGFLAQKDPPSTEATTLRQQIAVENLNYANAKTRLYPKANAILAVSQDQQNNIYGSNANYSLTSLYAGVSVTWTLFDGFASGAAERSSLARRRQMENDYQQLTSRLAQDAQTQVKQIDFSARNMAIADRQLVNSEGALKSVQEDFRQKTKSEADVSQARLALFDAQLGAYNARMDYLARTGEFLGTLMEDPALAKVASDK